MNKDYAVKCKKDFGELYLSVTQNGYQWSSLAIKDPEREIPLIIAELQMQLPGAGCPCGSVMAHASWCPKHKG